MLRASRLAALGRTAAWPYTLLSPTALPPRRWQTVVNPPVVVATKPSYPSPSPSSSSSSSPTATNSLPEDTTEPPLADPAAFRTTGRHLASFARPEAPLLLGSFGLLAVAQGVQLALPKGVQYVTDAISSGIPILTVDHLPLAGLLFLGAALGGLATYGRIVLSGVASVRVIARLQSTLFSGILHQPTSYFDENKSGDLLSRLSADTLLVGSVITDTLPGMARQIITATGSFGMMVVTSPHIAGGLIFLLVPVALVSYSTGQRLQQVSRELQDALGDAGTVASERFNNIKTVKSFAREEYEVVRFWDKILVARGLGVTYHKMSATFMAGLQFWVYVLMMGLVAGGGHLVSVGALTSGQLTAFLMYSIFLTGAGLGMGKTWMNLRRGIGASERVFSLLTTTKAEEPIKLPERPVDTIGGSSLDFSSVSFAYPTRPEVPVWNGLSLKIEAGSCVGIVGESGSGKSTLPAILLGLYPPQGGVVRVGGVDIKELNPDWHRLNVGYVAQEPALFGDTIAVNIAYSNPEASREDVIAAAKQAQAHQFIENLPNGYDTLVGERGATLSGGQKQRVAIARALIGDPKILLLDEATSALDYESATAVLETLTSLVQDRSSRRTIILITHHFSALKHVDAVAVLHQGRVAEMGSFDKLAEDPNSMLAHLMTQHAGVRTTNS